MCTCYCCVKDLKYIEPALCKCTQCNHCKSRKKRRKDDLSKLNFRVTEARYEWFTYSHAYSEINCNWSWISENIYRLFLALFLHLHLSPSSQHHLFHHLPFLVHPQLVSSLSSIQLHLLLLPSMMCIYYIELSLMFLFSIVFHEDKYSSIMKSQQTVKLSGSSYKLPTNSSTLPSSDLQPGEFRRIRRKPTKARTTKPVDPIVAKVAEYCVVMPFVFTPPPSTLSHTEPKLKKTETEVYGKFITILFIL